MRRPRIVFIPCAVLLFAVSNGVASDLVYVINSKKPSVSIVDAENWKVAGSIPLAGHPSWAAIEPTNRFLYILHYGELSRQGTAAALATGGKDPSSLAVVDLAKREVIKTIPLPSQVRTLAFSDDRRYLISSARCKLRQTSSFGLRGPGRVLPTRDDGAANLQPETTGYLTVIDTRENSVKVAIPIGSHPRQVLWTKDASRIFVLAAGSLAKAKRWPKDPDPFLAVQGLAGEDERVFVLSPDAAKPLAEIPIERPASMMVLSKDENWLYVLQPGTPAEDLLHRSMGGKLQIQDLETKKKEHVAGKLLVIDAAAAKTVASYDVGAAPRGLHLDRQTGTLFLLSQAGPEDYAGKLYRVRESELLPPLAVGQDPQFPVRCQGDAGVRIVTTEDVRLLNDQGQWAGEPLVLNRILKPGERAGKPTQIYLGDTPTMPLCLPKMNTLALLTKTVRLGLVDLGQNKLVEFFYWGFGGGPLGAFAAGFAGLPLEGGGPIAANPGRLMDLMNAEQMGSISQDQDSGPWQVAPRPDGAFVYFFDADSGKVLMIDVKKPSIVGTLRFGQGCDGIRRPPGGKFVFGVHSGSVTVLDTATNQQRFKHRITGETVRHALTRKQGSQLLVLGTTTMQAVDPESGKVLGTITGLNEPTIVAEPSAPPAM